MDNKKVFLHDIETVVPPKSYTQEFVLDFFSNLGEIDDRLKSFMGKIYMNSAIDKRHTVIEDYDKDPKDYTFYPKNKELTPSPSTKDRNDLFIQEANNLSLQATEKLFEGSLNIKPQDVTHLITISCTGFSAPGFDLHLMKQLNLNPHTRRFNIGFMGCYAAFTGMDMAKSICEANPKARVLMVNVELCSIHFQPKSDLDTMVANALFADGVSAALISGNEGDSDGNKLVLETFQSQLIPDSEEHMAWYPGNHGFDMKLSAYVPKVIDRNIQDVLANILKKSELTQKDIDIWAIHPGGKAILEKVAVSLGLETEELQVSYDVLRNYGNMSSSTIMFILRRILNDTREGRILGLGFGPGLTIETGCFQKILCK